MSSRLPPTTCTLPLLETAAFVALAALFALPVAWQNILGGFHSQQYWLLLLSFLAMVALPFARPWSGRWWLAAFTATVALLTMGSGFFAAGVVFGVVTFRWLRRETTLRETWPTLALTLVLVVVGWFTRVEVDYHQGLKAKSAHDFFLSIVHSLQWPAPREYTWLAAVLWLPWLLAVWQTGRAGLRPARGGSETRPTSSSPACVSESRAALTLAALGGWVVAQVVATAYARGVGGDYPASRYMDTLGFGMAVNAVALAWLVSRLKAGDQETKGPKDQGTKNPNSKLPVPWSLGPLVPWSLSFVWLGVFSWGVYDIAHLGLAIEMPDVKRFYVNAEAHMRGFLVTNDPAQLAFDDIPYPNAGALIDRLNRANLRALMPVSIRPPLPLRATAPNAAFAENNASQLHLETAPRIGLSPATAPLASHPTWGSFGANGAAVIGEWTSASLTAPLGGWLKFETAGDVGREGVALELRDAASQALLATVQPTKIPGDTWRAAYVRAPRKPFVVVARDESATRWLAFSAPVEMGNLSYAAWQCTKNGLLVAEIAAVAAALLGLAALVVGRGRRTPP